MTKVFFGFGHGFGGTHLLARLLNIHSHVDCKHERKGPMSKYAMFDRYMAVFHGNALAGDQAVTEERVPMISPIVKSGKVFGEANGILGFFVAALAKAFPDSKFIYTMRDPRAQVRTAHNTGIFNKDVSADILKAHPDWDSVWWWPRPALEDGISKDWTTLSDFEKCAWFWAAYNDFVLQQVEQLLADRVFVLKFEDMVAGRKIMEVYDFLNLKKPTPAQVQKIVSVKHAQTVERVSNPIPKWDQMGPRTQQQLLEFVEPTMKKLGYNYKRSPTVSTS